MDLKHYFVQISDFYFRFRNRLRKKLRKISEFSSDSNLSDSQVSFYIDNIREILKSEDKLERFRRSYDYREILEHVNYKLGNQYLEQIKVELPESWERTVLVNKVNDIFGNPYTYNYRKIGLISPTTLRYVYTAIEINRQLEIKPQDSVVEIGIGYGGQSAVMQRLFGIERITVFDLQEVQELARLYLRKIGSPIELIDGNLKLQDSWDLAISNYAFSELPRELQLWYLEHVLARAQKGYMVMNSGMTNFTGRSSGKLRIEEIKEYIPNLVIASEQPKSGPDNYVAIWKNS